MIGQFLILFLLVISKGEATAPISLILGHLKVTKLQFCYFFICWNKSEYADLVKDLNIAEIRYSFLATLESARTALQEKDLTYYGFVLDLNCQKWENILFQEIDKDNMRLTHPWFIIANTSNSNHSYWRNIFKNVNLRMDSNVKLAISMNQHNSFKILDLYNQGFQLGEDPLIIQHDLWNGEQFEIENKENNFYLERKNMRKVKLRSGNVVLITNHSETFEEYMFNSKHTEFDTMSKFHYPLFLLLEDVHNFTHSLAVEDKWFGNYQNGTDGGIGKLLYENQIDITSTGASQRPPRYDAYDYLAPSYHFRPCYIFRNPGTYDPLSNEFLKPFATIVWYLTFLTGIVIAIALKLFYKLERPFSREKFGYSWVASVLTTLSVIFQQDAAAFPTGSAGRIAFLVLQMLSLLLYNYYTSSIISSLLRKPPNAFDTLDQLAHSQLEIGIEDLPYTLTWFEIMNDSDVQHIYKYKVYPPGAQKMNIYEPEEGIAKVRQGLFAYHTQLDTGYPIIARTFDQDAICDIRALHMIPQVAAGMMVQKKSQYRELFHITLRQIRDAGLVHRISHIWEAKKPECLASATVVAVNINQVFIAFLTLFIGIITALLLLIIETFWFKFNLGSKFQRK